MTDYTDAAGQIADEIEAQHIWPLEAALGPGEEWNIIRQRVSAAARAMAAQLASGDDRLAAQTVIDLASLILPDPVPDDYWATPLGRLTAQSVGHPSAEAVSYTVAGAMLRISKQRVEQLVRAGKLERHPDGGVTSASVRMRARERLCAGGSG